jgi:hypothetical protein
MEQTFDTPGHVRAGIKIPSGRIAVRATERTTAHVRVEGERDPGDVRVSLDPLPDGGHQLSVEFRGKRTFGLLSLGRELDVDLEVPAGTDLVADAGSADLVCEGLLGSIEYRTGSGDVRFEAVTGNVTTKSGSGDIDGHSVGGDLSVHSASGDVAIGSVAGSATVRTASGDLRLGPIGRNVQVITVSGDVDLTSIGSGWAKVRAVSGDIDVGVAPGISVYLDISSTSGDVRSDLDAGGAPATGVADLELTATSVSGDISIRRAPARVDGT